MNWSDAQRRVVKSYREWIRAVCSHLHFILLLAVRAGRELPDFDSRVGEGEEGRNWELGRVGNKMPGNWEGVGNKNARGFDGWCEMRNSEYVLLICFCG